MVTVDHSVVAVTVDEPWYKICLYNIEGDLLDEGYIATDDEFQEYKVM